MGRAKGLQAPLSIEKAKDLFSSVIGERRGSGRSREAPQDIGAYEYLWPFSDDGQNIEVGFRRAEMLRFWYHQMNRKSHQGLRDFLSLEYIVRKIVQEVSPGVSYKDAVRDVEEMARRGCLVEKKSFTGVTYAYNKIDNWDQTLKNAYAQYIASQPPKF